MSRAVKKVAFEVAEITLRDPAGLVAWLRGYNAYECLDSPVIRRDAALLGAFMTSGDEASFRAALERDIGCAVAPA